MNEIPELSPEQKMNSEKNMKAALQALKDADERRIRKKYPTLDLEEAKKRDRAELKRLQVDAEARIKTVRKRQE